MNEKLVTGFGGKTICVSTADEECVKFGFFSGETVITNFNEEVIIQGAAPALEGSKFAGQDVMWFLKDDGFVYYTPGNLKEAGFVAKNGLSKLNA